VYRKAFDLLKNLNVEPPEPFDSWWGRVKIISPASLVYRNLKQRTGTGDKPERRGWALDSYIYRMSLLILGDRRVHLIAPGQNPALHIADLLEPGLLQELD